jgi:hypothetical protein
MRYFTSKPLLGSSDHNFYKYSNKMMLNIFLLLYKYKLSGLTKRKLRP